MGRAGSVGVVLFEQRVEAPVVVAEGGADHLQSSGKFMRRNRA